MSEPQESLTTDLGAYSLDDEDQLQPGDTLDDDDVDVLDRGYSPPDTDRGSRAHGVTASEQHRDETIEQRIAQEVPDPTSAYGALYNESGLHELDRIGGDAPASSDADHGCFGDLEVHDPRAGRLVAPDRGVGEDSESLLIGEDVGIDGAAASAEEAAMHVIARLPEDNDSE